MTNRTSFYPSTGRNQEFLSPCCVVPAETLHCIVQVIVARTRIVIMYKIQELFHPYHLPSQIYVFKHYAFTKYLQEMLS